MLRAASLRSRGCHLTRFRVQVLHPDLLNKNVLAAQYAVRGELYLRVRRRCHLL